MILGIDMGAAPSVHANMTVFLCILAGIGLGRVFPGVFHAVGELEVAHINLPVTALIF